MTMGRRKRTPAEIAFDRRTAIIDANGRVAAIYSGTDWTPAQLVADLTAAPAPAR